MVRRQAAADLEHMRSELHAAKSRLGTSENRDVDEVAALQASRQEKVSLQQSINEKDHLLKMSQSQCRSLEDAIEDRDKEVDQLKRKLELLLRKAGGLELSSEQYDNSHLADDSIMRNESPRPSSTEKSSTGPDSKRTSLGVCFAGNKLPSQSAG